MQPSGRYASFAELARSEVPDVDYRVTLIDRPASAVCLVAPHGGLIENGTSELARAIAGNEHSVFSFEGLKPDGDNRSLHITSHLFDHPACVALVARSSVVISVHGCRGEARIHVGGLDVELAAALCAALDGAGFAASTTGHGYPGRHPANICNRGSSGRGAQLEITHDLRVAARRKALAGAVRAVIAGRAPRAAGAQFPEPNASR